MNKTVSGTQRTEIEARDVFRSFNGQRALDGVDLSVRSGETIAIIGPSGCGKTTLLRALIGLERIDRGVIYIRGFNVTDASPATSDCEYESLDQLRSDIGFVFQQAHLWPHLTVLDNVLCAPLLVRRETRSVAEERCRALLEEFGLGERLAAYPEALSGGQRQRVAIARTLAMNPSVLLLDEVTTSLDPEIVFDILAHLRRVVGKGNTVLVVTHEMGFARDIADRVIFMDRGKVLEDGPAERFFNQPSTRRAKVFLEKVLSLRR